MTSRRSSPKRVLTSGPKENNWLCRRPALWCPLELTSQEAQSLLDRHATQLSEHFGAVQIVVSKILSNGSTQGRFAGSGDWYARKALCMEFVERDQANTVAFALKQNEET
jgi:hypothetical protein